jgi:hypothetical protein
LKFKRSLNNATTTPAPQLLPVLKLIDAETGALGNSLRVLQATCHRGQCCISSTAAAADHAPTRCFSAFFSLIAIDGGMKGT